VIIVLDPDCLINRPIDFQELVTANKPIAQKGLYCCCCCCCCCCCYVSLADNPVDSILYVC
jgi:hypothetical protein